MTSRSGSRLTAESRRASLIETATGIFSTLPYESVRLDEVATQAKCSRALLYRYFPSKRTLFLAVIQNVIGEISESTLPQVHEATDDIRAGLLGYFEWAQRNAARHQLTAAAAIMDPEVQIMVKDRRKRALELLLAVLPLEGRSRDEAEFTVDTWVAFVASVCLEWLDQPEDASAAYLADVCADTLASMLEPASTIP